MTKLIKILFTVFIATYLIIAPFVCNAADYYISPSGNDGTGDGSIGNPWKTLYKATNTVTTGNTINVLAGTYDETLSSILATGVNILGVGETSIIRSTFSTEFQAIIYANSGTEGTDGSQTISYLKFDGQGATSWGIQIQARSNVTITQCTFVDFAQRGVVWGGRTDNDDLPPETTYATGNVFSYNTMTDCSSFDGTYGYGSLNIGGQTGMLIHHNSIITTGATPGWPIKLWNDGYVKGLKIYNNTLIRPPYPYSINGTSNYFDFCIELFNQEGIEIYNNIIEGSIDLNYQTKGSYDYSTYIHDNIVGRDTPAEHWETGVWLEFQTEDCIIENNVFKNVSHVIMFSLRPASYMNRIYIRNNLAYGIAQSDDTRQGRAVGVIMNEESTNYSADVWEVYNNTFIAIDGDDAPFFGINIPGGNSSTDIAIQNNVFANFNYYVMTCDEGDDVDGLLIKNNNLYNNGNSNAIEFNNGSAANYTNSGNITTAPGLDVSYYPTVPTSPLIDAGIDVGLPYYGSAPDIGFYETGAPTGGIKFKRKLKL